MLEIFLLISAASSFAKIAFDKNLNRYLWGSIAVGSYLLGQVLMVFFIALVNPDVLNNTASLTVCGVCGGLICVGIAYVILRRIPEKEDHISINKDLLDSKMD
jgi:hypothetical protein